MKAVALVLLLALAGCAQPTPDPDTPPGTPMTFRAPVDLGSKARAGALGTNCQDSVVDGDCGLGEPQVEVDAAGTIYVSGVCCLTVSPPVYVSRDGGATFEEMRTPTNVRESFGIEGDFAVDAKGRVYFADIEFVATFQVTVWEADGTFVRHTKWPAPPIVDRDWVRAEGDGIVYYVYNTGAQTHVYKSTDAAATFSPSPIYTAPFALGFAIAGPQDGQLWIVGGNDGGRRQGHLTADGGLTWTTERTSMRVGDDFYPTGAFDEAGRLILAEAEGDAIKVAVRQPDGTWGEPSVVSPAGHHRMPWVAAGRDGAAVMAWYGTPDAEIGASSQWFLHVAATRDAGATWSVQVADPEPVFTGALGRDLLDFFQVELGPDGAVHVAYSKLPPGGEREEQLTYVRSEPDAHLAAMDYRNGPVGA
jgi:hypothetical protein